MRSLTLADLVDLIVSEVPDPEERVERVFQWQYERESMAVKGVAGIGASLLLGLFAAFVNDHLSVATWQLSVILSGILAMGVVGAGLLVRMRRIQTSYVAALNALGQFRRIKPFLDLVRARRDIQDGGR